MTADTSGADGVDPDTAAAVLDTSDPDRPDLPDLTHVIVADMVEGVKRYDATADMAEAEIETWLTEHLPRKRAEVVEYRAKASALSDMLARAGYDPDTGRPTTEDERGGTPEPEAEPELPPSE